MMNRIGFGALAAALCTLAGCGGGGSSSGGGTPTPPPVVINNVQPVVVNSGPSNQEADVLYTSVTICVPGTSTCQTIPNIQVDTGSSGLRLLNSQVTLTLPNSTDASGNVIGNCVQFLDTSYIWGPVALADVKFADEVASSLPVQLGAQWGRPTSFPAAPTVCSSGGTAVTTPSTLGANGILGVGNFIQDCGQGCANASSKYYYSCTTTACTQAAVPVARQLTNPVAKFPQDNNGLLISLPALPDAGQVSATGSMIFGIGTQTNNALGAARVQTISPSTGNFSTTFSGKTYSSSFLDTGSNGLFFTDTATALALGLPACASPNSAFYCPTSQKSFSAITTGVNNTANTVTFNIANLLNLPQANSAFNNIGGSQPGYFDWGLPFFFGKSVFVALELSSTPGGNGPYWAY